MNPRSEQLALDELALKDWMMDLPGPHPTLRPTQGQLTHRGMNIDYIQQQAVNAWVWEDINASEPLGVYPYTDYEVPPPWNPTLQDVEDLITADEGHITPDECVSMAGKLIQIIQYRGRYNVDLNSPLLGEHLTYLNSLCNECEDLYDRVTDTDEDDDDDFDDDFDEYTVEPMSPETLRIINRSLDEEFMAESDATTHDIITGAARIVTSRLQEWAAHNTLCSEGVYILDTIMDTDDRVLNEGDYLTLMNLFRDLHT